MIYNDTKKLLITYFWRDSGSFDMLLDLKSLNCLFSAKKIF
jgi:hypothetical protein